MRVVAHSLGCRFVVEALRSMPKEMRPNEVHLCAPAITEEEELGNHLHHLSSDNDSAYLYHCDRDLILSKLFSGTYFYLFKV